MAEPALAQTEPTGAPPARTQLVRSLVDVLSLPDGRQTANERVFVAEILGAAMLNAPLADRRWAAGRLAGTGNVPHGLLRQMVLDDPAVATPLLRASAQLPDGLLIEAAGVSVAHRRAIADRESLTEGVADAVLAHGEAEIASTVLRRDVPVSVARLDALVAASRADPTLTASLIARPDLQITHALAMFWWCGAPDRRRLLTRFAVDRSVLQETLQPLFAQVFTDPDADPVVRRLLHVIDRRHRPRGRDGEMVTMDVVERTLTVARAQPTADLAHAVGLLAGVSTPCATRILDDPSGEAFAVLTKSIGVRRGAFAAILDSAAVIAPDAGPAATPEGRERMLVCFDVTTHDYARAALRYWDWRPDPVASPPAPPVGTTAPASAADTSYLGAL